MTHLPHRTDLIHPTRAMNTLDAHPGLTALFLCTLDDPAIPGKDDDLPWNLFPAHLQRFFHRLTQSPATRHFHADDQKRAYLICRKDLCELFCMIDTIQFQASDHRHTSLRNVSW